MQAKDIWIAQLNPTVGDIRGNLKRMLESIQQAKKAGAKLIVFPELCVSGYTERFA